MLDSEAGRMIVPVVNIPIPIAMVQTDSASASDATSSVIRGTSATADTFLLGINLTVAKDVNSTSIFSELQAIPFMQSSATSVFRIRYEPVTAGDHQASIMFDPPILLARGSNITVANSTAIASIDTTANIFFYEIED